MIVRVAAHKCPQDRGSAPTTLGARTHRTIKSGRSYRAWNRDRNWTRSQLREPVRKELVQKPDLLEWPLASAGARSGAWAARSGGPVPTASRR